MTGPYEATGAYRPDALAQLENTEPQWFDVPATPTFHSVVLRTDEHGFTRQYCGACNVFWPCGEVTAFREERGRLGLGIAFVITLIGLLLYGQLQSGKHPDMRVVSSAAIAGTFFLFLGCCIAGYRRRERQGTSSTTKTAKSLQQDTSDEHYWDGA